MLAMHSQSRETLKDSRIRLPYPLGFSQTVMKLQNGRINFGGDILAFPRFNVVTKRAQESQLFRVLFLADFRDSVEVGPQDLWSSSHHLVGLVSELKGLCQH